MSQLRDECPQRNGLTEDLILPLLFKATVEMTKSKAVFTKIM